MSDQFTTSSFEDAVRGDLADVPLICEDLCCQVEQLRELGVDEAAIAELLADLDLLQDC